MSVKGSVLVVDDEASVRGVLAEALRAHGYAVVPAASVGEARAAVERERFDVALVDKNLGDGDGLELLERLRSLDPEMEGLVMTAHATLESALLAIRLGIFDYILKPFDQVEMVLYRVDRACEKRRRDLELRSLITRMATINRQIADMVATLHESYIENAKVMARLCELRNPSRQGEAERVRHLAVRLARECGLGPSDTRWLETAALVHDLGESGELDRIITKTGQLTDEEKARVRRHPLESEALLRAVDGLDPLAAIVRHHHERVDGEGYPDRLRGEQIPLGARILAVADAYVALTSPRPYRSACDPEVALATVREAAGTQFDPKVVAAMDRILAAGIPPADGDVALTSDAGRAAGEVRVR